MWSLPWFLHDSKFFLCYTEWVPQHSSGRQRQRNNQYLPKRGVTSPSSPSLNRKHSERSWFLLTAKRSSVFITHFSVKFPGHWILPNGPHTPRCFDHIWGCFVLTRQKKDPNWTRLETAARKCAFMHVHVYIAKKQPVDLNLHCHLIFKVILILVKFPFKNEILFFNIHWLLLLPTHNTLFTLQWLGASIMVIVCE